MRSGFTTQHTCGKAPCPEGTPTPRWRWRVRSKRSRRIRVRLPLRRLRSHEQPAPRSTNFRRPDPHYRRSSASRRDRQRQVNPRLSTRHPHRSQRDPVHLCRSHCDTVVYTVSVHWPHRASGQSPKSKHGQGAGTARRARRRVPDAATSNRRKARRVRGVYFWLSRRS